MFMLPEKHGHVGPTVSRRSYAREFGKFFTLWAGIIAIPCLLVFSQNGIQYARFLTVFLAPAVVFGAIGATVITFLVSPGQLLRGGLAGILVGLVLPAAVFWGLLIILP
jgi:FtsH-binding integral membrane protein